MSLLAATRAVVPSMDSFAFAAYTTNSDMGASAPLDIVPSATELLGPYLHAVLEEKRGKLGKPFPVERAPCYMDASTLPSGLRGCCALDGRSRVDYCPTCTSAPVEVKMDSHVSSVWELSVHAEAPFGRTSPRSPLAAENEAPPPGLIGFAPVPVFAGVDASPFASPVRGSSPAADDL